MPAYIRKWYLPTSAPADDIPVSYEIGDVEKVFEYVMKSKATTYRPARRHPLSRPAKIRFNYTYRRGKSPELAGVLKSISSKLAERGLYLRPHQIASTYWALTTNPFQIISTGQGKTLIGLTTALASLHALSDGGESPFVMVQTSNDYLAYQTFKDTAELYSMFGLKAVFMKSHGASHYEFYVMENRKIRRVSPSELVIFKGGEAWANFDVIITSVEDMNFVSTYGYLDPIGMDDHEKRALAAILHSKSFMTILDEADNVLVDRTGPAIVSKPSYLSPYDRAKSAAVRDLTLALKEEAKRIMDIVRGEEDPDEFVSGIDATYIIDFRITDGKIRSTADRKVVIGRHMIYISGSLVPYYSYPVKDVFETLRKAEKSELESDLLSSLMEEIEKKYTRIFVDKHKLADSILTGLKEELGDKISTRKQSLIEHKIRRVFESEDSKTKSEIIEKIEEVLESQLGEHLSDEEMENTKRSVRTAVETAYTLLAEDDLSFVLYILSHINHLEDIIYVSPDGTDYCPRDKETGEPQIGRKFDYEYAAAIINSLLGTSIPIRIDRSYVHYTSKAGNLGQVVLQAMSGTNDVKIFSEMMEVFAPPKKANGSPQEGGRRVTRIPTYQEVLFFGSEEKGAKNINAGGKQVPVQYAIAPAWYLKAYGIEQKKEEVFYHKALGPVDIIVPENGAKGSGKSPVVEELQRKIIEHVKPVVAEGRPVLVVAFSLRDTKAAVYALRNAGFEVDVVDERNEKEIYKRAGEPGKITVVFKKGGRGIDIKIPESVRRRGGLHVLAIGPFPNERAIHQVFGRAGRSTDPGSVSLIIAPPSDPVMASIYRKILEKTNEVKGSGEKISTFGEYVGYERDIDLLRSIYRVHTSLSTAQVDSAIALHTTYLLSNWHLGRVMEEMNRIMLHGTREERIAAAAAWSDLSEIIFNMVDFYASVRSLDYTSLLRQSGPVANPVIMAISELMNLYFKSEEIKNSRIFNTDESSGNPADIRLIFKLNRGLLGEDIFSKYAKFATILSSLVVFLLGFAKGDMPITHAKVRDIPQSSLGSAVSGTNIRSLKGEKIAGVLNPRSLIEWFKGYGEVGEIISNHVRRLVRNDSISTVGSYPRVEDALFEAFMELKDRYMGLVKLIEERREEFSSQAYSLLLASLTNGGSLEIEKWWEELVELSTTTTIDEYGNQISPFEIAKRLYFENPEKYEKEDLVKDTMQKIEEATKKFMESARKSMEEKLKSGVAQGLKEAKEEKENQQETAIRQSRGEGNIIRARVVGTPLDASVIPHARVISPTPARVVSYATRSLQEPIPARIVSPPVPRARVVGPPIRARITRVSDLPVVA